MYEIRLPLLKRLSGFVFLLGIEGDLKVRAACVLVRTPAREPCWYAFDIHIGIFCNEW